MRTIDDTTSNTVGIRAKALMSNISFKDTASSRTISVRNERMEEVSITDRALRFSLDSSLP
jgi:hypothetical protein